MQTMVSTAGSAPGSLESPDVLAPGAKAGPWIVERELGRGGMGAVYAVVHEEIGKRAALKLVHKRLLSSGFNSDRMVLEAKVVNQVGHANIVDIFETGKLADGRPYIVMERLDGQSLSARAETGKLLPDQVIAILLEVTDALIAAHAAGVVHRDLKLDNVFLADNPDDPMVPKIKLLDWGIAKLIHHDVKHTIEGQLVGTPQYLSPEQARGQAVTPQSDVYSLGVMAYELFLEQLPFEAETAAEVMAMHLRMPPPPPRELWPDVPPLLEDLLLAMLAKRADQRPTAVEVARRLVAVREELARRCHVHAAPRLRAVVTPIHASRPHRVASSGLAATDPAWPTSTRRWRYAIGAAALAVSTMLLLISRLADHPARAAGAELTTASRADAASAPDLPGWTASPTAVGTRLAAGDTAMTVRRAVAVRTELVPASRAPMRAPAARAESRAQAPTRQTPPAATPRDTSSRSPSATPRRGAKLDPDGTLDAYM